MKLFHCCKAPRLKHRRTTGKSACGLGQPGRCPVQFFHCRSNPGQARTSSAGSWQPCASHLLLEQREAIRRAGKCQAVSRARSGMWVCGHLVRDEAPGIPLRREGLGVKENQSHPPFRVTFCIATLNLASYSKDKAERKVNGFWRSGVMSAKNAVNETGCAARGRRPRFFRVGLRVAGFLQ